MRYLQGSRTFSVSHRTNILALIIDGREIQKSMEKLMDVVIHDLTQSIWFIYPRKVILSISIDRAPFGQIEQLY